MMIVEPKMAQPVELDEESIYLFNSTDWKVQKPSLYSRMLIRLIKVELYPVKYWSRDGQGLMITYHALNANG